MVKHLVAAAKSAHERLMIDECEITRIRQGSFDDTTGKRVEISETVYSGPCRVKFANVEQRNAGERNNVVNAPVLNLPADDESDIRERDVCEVTDSTNPNLIGKRFSIIGSDIATTASARRFEMEAQL